jgi:hypothetical protein
VRAYRPHRVFSGDHIRKVIPVPIPNTEVKLSEPMIVHTSVKVGIAGFLKPLVNIVSEGFFRFLLLRILMLHFLAHCQIGFQLATSAETL